MDTRNATPGDEVLPGQEFRDRNGLGFAQFTALSVADSGTPGGRDPDRHHLRGNSWHVRWVESTGSTNDDLTRAARNGAPDLVVLVADHQTAGRGRLDRRWEAPSGENLLVSILFRSVPDRPHQLTQAVALAAVDVCRLLTRTASPLPDVSVKWPNDIVIGSRKLGGILATASTERRSRSADGLEVSVPEYVVVGLGLNVRWSPNEAVSLGEFVDDPHRDDVLFALLASLDRLLDLDPMDLHDRYRRELSTIGRAVRVDMPSGDVLEGRALGVGIDGRLEVLDACAVSHHIDVADIVHLRFSS